MHNLRIRKRLAVTGSRHSLLKILSRQTNIFIVIFASVYFTSCISMFFSHNTNLWFYTYSNGETPKNLNLTPASFLYLGQHKNYTLDFGGFEFGKWEKHKDSIVLHAANGNTRIYPVNFENEKDLKLSIGPGNIADFSGVASSFSSEADNPFSLPNNRWRIPASHKETSAEIKERLLNHFTFWKAYFTWALDNNIQYIDVRSTPTPIKIYSNGFALKSFDELPAQWKQYFYDSADCRTANNMINEIFARQNIAWATTADKYKMFAGAFEQLQNYLKQQ